MSTPQNQTSNPFAGRPGRILTAIIGGLDAAVPDYFPKKAPKRIIRSGLAVAMVALSAAAEFSPFEDSDGDGESDLKEAVNSAFDTAADTLEADSLSPAVTLAAIGGSVVGLGALAMWLEEKTDELMAKPLRRVGVKKPHTLIGLLLGASLFFASEVEAKLDAEDAVSTES